MNTKEINILNLKEGDEVIVESGSNWLVGERGKVVKILDKPIVTDFLMDMPEELIKNGKVELDVVVDFPDIRGHYFNSYHDSNVPKEEKKWVRFPRGCLKMTPPLSARRQLEIAAEKLGGHASFFTPNPFMDGSCIVSGCTKCADIYAGVNIWGCGHLFRFCKDHAKQYGGRWSDGLDFLPKTKQTLLALPPKSADYGSQKNLSI